MITDNEFKKHLELFEGISVEIIMGGLEIRFPEDEVEQMPAVLAEIAAVIDDYWDESECCITYDYLPEQDSYVIRYGDERIK